MTTDQAENYMLQAIELAKNGLGSVEPNPAVGCVIVKDDRIIGSGWHKAFGKPHAEIEALKDCQKNGHNPQTAQMYVNLEPCCHAGKTPPCTQAIIQAKISKVFIAAIDPSKHANGKGIEQLRQAHIDVQVETCAQQAKLLNAWFFKYAATKRPWVTLKWAQSVDGKLAWPQDDKQRWISNQASRKDVHDLRRRIGAILVGANTAVIDDPLLTARPAGIHKAVRVILDDNLVIPLNRKILDTTQAQTLIFTTELGRQKQPDKFQKLFSSGAEVVVVQDLDGRCDLEHVLSILGKRGVWHVLVEGGVQVHTSFLQSNLADQVTVYVSPKTIGRTATVQASEIMAQFADKDRLLYSQVKDFEGDLCITGLLHEV